MNTKRRKPTLIWAFLSLCTVLGVMLLASLALAETLNVSGADSFFAEGQEKVDLLSVTGQAGKTI